jgi:PKD repeat protein
VPIQEDSEIISATWHWGDGNSTEADLTDTAAVGSHTYSEAGIYRITLEVTDDCGTATSPAAQVEVTDEALPGTGSVKGTGMFSSPRGAYTDKPQMKGMAHYSISAKAENGEVSATFQFHIADLQFRRASLTN